nr:30S ribosomal protein S4 [Candidatus Omnitrophota bacterium]
SFLVDKDDLIQIKAKDKALNKIKDNLELSKERTVPSWLEFKAADFSAKVLRLPERDDIQQTIQEQLIVELYSK